MIMNQTFEGLVHP